MIIIVEVALGIVAGYFVIQALRFLFHASLIVWASMADKLGVLFASSVVLLVGVVAMALAGLAVFFMLGNQ
jgi:hypothetical protein